MPATKLPAIGLTAGACAVLTSSLLAAGCQPAVPPSAVTLAVKADIVGVFPNPPFWNEGYTLRVHRSVLETLVGFDHSLGIEPMLAERWENPDDRTYRLWLRPDLRFSNGAPIRARDVVASLEAVRQRGWATSDYLHAIESVEAKGERQIEIRTHRPYLVLLTRLPFGFVLPADVLDEDPVPLIGSGPYRLESWKPGEELALARNPHYRGPTPAFERARRIVVPDDAERVRWVLEGRAVVADQVPLGAVPELEARSDVRVISQPGLRVLFLNLRIDRPPLDDPGVREAIDLALDREEIVARVYEGRTVPASQIVPPAVVGHAPSLAPTVPDRRRARQLLAEAGYAEGLELRLDGPNNRYVRDEPLLHEVARQLEEVGIHVTVNAQPKQDFFALQEARQSSFFLLGWACESGDAGDALDAIAHSPVEGFLGSDNGVGLQDTALDRLIDASNASSNNLERTRLMQQAMTRLASVRAFLPLVVQPETVLLSNRVTWTAPLTFAIQPEDLRPVP